MQAQAFSYAAKLNHIVTTGWVLCYAGVILEQFFTNVAAVSAHTKTHATLMAEHGMNTYQGVMGFYEGWAMASSDEVEKGIALMQRSLALLEAKNVASHRPHFLSLLAQVQVREGDYQSALALCTDALERARRTEQHYFDAEIYRIEGEARRAAGHAVFDVGHCFGRALEISRRQGARMFELRAAMALARLWRGQGRKVEARDLLAPIYGWFTEGFDTIDLKAAKALLAELSE